MPFRRSFDVPISKAALAALEDGALIGLDAMTATNNRQLIQCRRIAADGALADLLVLPFVRFDAVPAPRELDPQLRVFGPRYNAQIALTA